MEIGTSRSVTSSGNVFFGVVSTTPCCPKRTRNTSPKHSNKVNYGSSRIAGIFCFISARARCWKPLQRDWVEHDAGPELSPAHLRGLGSEGMVAFRTLLGGPG